MSRRSKKYQINWHEEPIIAGKKYLCKKSLEEERNYRPQFFTVTNIIFEENHFYLVKESKKLSVEIFSKHGIITLSPTPISSVTPLLFWDYFYTKQEERYLKLRKIGLPKG